jgi:3-hydroxyisobutyrate dehydrogenase
MALRAGFVGLGDIGGPMARRLAGAGAELGVFDVAPAAMQPLLAAGARAAASPAELARASDVLGVCVPEDAHVRAVALGPDGILAGAAPGAIVAIHSTILPETAVEVGRACAERGVAVLDACVTGGAARAAQGKLTCLVGGDAGVLERARPYLALLAERIVHAGPLGSGCKLKLCLNVITYLQWTAAFEAMSLARAVDLPVAVLEEAGRANGQITELMVQYMALHKAPPETRRSEGTQRALRGFMHIAEKDLAWALELGRRSGVSLPGTALASQTMARIYAVEDEKRR